MENWSVGDLRFFPHCIIPTTGGSCRFRLWRLCLEARLKRAFFIPCKKLDLPKRLIPL